jgi:hypothetical protein
MTIKSIKKSSPRKELQSSRKHCVNRAEDVTRSGTDRRDIENIFDILEEDLPEL